MTKILTWLRGKQYNLPLGVAGLLSVWVQTVFLRELMVVCQGNELSLGAVLAGWLLGGAAGSWAASRPSGLGRIDGRTGLAASMALLGIVTVPALATIRGFKTLAHYFPGQEMPVGHVLALALAIMVPVGALIGALYSFGVRYLDQSGVRSPAGNAYMAEAAGFLIGGLVLTFVLLSSLNHSAILLASAVLSLASATLIADARWLKALSAVLLALTAAAGSQVAKLETATQAWLYPGYRIQEVRGSPYGQNVVAFREGQTSFLYNGWPMASLPDLDIANSEEFVGWGLLFSERPRRALMVSGSWALPSLLAHGIDSAAYAELDPALIASMRHHWPEGQVRVLDDPRLIVVAGDARDFLERQDRRYGAIFVGLPYPSTLGINRYYTAEFLAAAKAHLEPGGTLVLALPGSEAAMDRPKARLNATVLHTLQAVFMEVKIVSGEINYYIAINGPAVPTDIADRFRQRHYASPALSEAYIKYRLEPQRERQLVEQLDGPERLRVNRDLDPSAVIAGMEYWQSISAPNWAKAYGSIVRLSGLLWLLVLAGLLLPAIGCSGTAFTAGSCSMGLQILCLWGLQIKNGAVYHWAGLMSALFMAGTAAGSWLVVRRPAQAIRPADILRLESVAIVFLAAWAILSIACDIPGWMFILTAGLNGLLLGIEFTCLVSAMAHRQDSSAQQEAGRIYAADMLGGFAAALCLGLVVIPAWGMVRAALLLLVVKLISAKWWTFNYRRIGA